MTAPRRAEGGAGRAAAVHAVLDTALAERADMLPPQPRLLTPSSTVARTLAAHGHTVTCGTPDEATTGGVDVVALLDDELSRAGERAAVLLDAAVGAVRPGGLLVASAIGAVVGDLGGAPAGKAFTANELAALLGSRGLTLDWLAAPGAAALLRGVAATFDPDLDRQPGLLDAGPHIVAVARTPRDMGERSAEFYASLPRKVIAASVICRDAGGRLLIVHDRFKRQWSIPGGVVDAGEHPRTAARRETWEETGVRVRVGEPLGIFAATWPDRLIFVFATEIDGEPAARPQPVHDHEIDEVAWVPLAEATDRLAPYVAAQVTRSLSSPGTIWPGENRA